MVKRNDKFSLEDIEKWDITHIIISPGPMSPKEAGMSNKVITHFGGKLPILGICLGHQCIGYVSNCLIGQHPNPTHGNKSEVFLSESKLFNKLPKQIEAGRYHSLYISRQDFNHDEFNITGELKDGTIMAIEHKIKPIFGVQFHPESILTGEYGKQILKNFVTM